MNVEGAPFRDRLARALPYLATALIVIGFANFFWFIAESMSMGDASQGKIVEGHYFLGNKGTYTEVDEAAWAWSQFHGTSIFITHPLAMAGMAYLLLRRTFPAQMAGSIAAEPEIARRRMEVVRSSGPVLASESMGGMVGPVRMTRPLLEVSVYPKGLIVRAKFMAEHAILAAEILSVRERRSLLQGSVEISHLGAGSKSPLLLYRAIDDPAVVAIRRMLADDAAAAAQPATASAQTAANLASSPASPIDRPLPVPGPIQDVATSDTGLGRRSLAGEPAIPGIDPRLSAVLEVLGLGVGVVLIAMGVLWAIPQLGLAGLAWTAFAGAILVWNASKFVRRHLRP